jgi:hypothetical protein
VNSLHSSGGLRAQFVFHLHRLHHDQPLAGTYLFADAGIHANHKAGHWRDHRRWTGWRCVFSRHLANRPSALVESLDVKAIPIDPQRIQSTLRAALYGDAMHCTVDCHEMDGSTIDVGEMSAQ